MYIDVNKWGIKAINDSSLDGTTMLIDKYRVEDFKEEVKKNHQLEAKIMDNEDCDDDLVVIRFFNL
jgi:hypothetical protein